MPCWIPDLARGICPYFKKAAERDPSLQFHGIEPDPYMIKRAEKRATETGILIDIRSDMAEALPYEDERFDIVIACSVLCTVSDVEQTLKAIHRVLKSDEELRFFNTCAQTGWEAAFGTLSHPSGSSSTLGVISIASPRRRSEKPLSK